MSLLEKIRKKKNGLSGYSSSYGYFVYPKLTGLLKNRMIFNEKEMIVWSINDYLGLTCDERVIKADTETVKEFGVGYPAGSRLLTGNTEYHELLESEISKLIGKSTLILNLGYPGIVSIVQSLVDRNDTIIYDKEVHASLIDGVKLHLGNRFPFNHNNIEHLQNRLEKVQSKRKEGSEVLVIVDGVFSMRGDVAKLKEIVNLKKTYDFTLLVDDAHGFQVFGEQGSVGYLDVMKSVDIYIGTFGKALGTAGGFVSANKDIVEYFKYNLRSQIFGKSLLLVNVMSILFKLDLLKAEGECRRKKLWNNTNSLQSGLQERGFNIGDTCSPITPVYIEGSEEIAGNFIRDAREDFGVFCSGVVYPVIPKGKIIIRLVVTSSHTNEDIKQTLNAFSELKNRHINY